MKVTSFDAEEEATQEAQNWVPEISMKKRHCARLDPTPKAIPHHEIGTGSELV
jgi:hypothetical protein